MVNFPHEISTGYVLSLEKYDIVSKYFTPIPIMLKYYNSYDDLYQNSIPISWIMAAYNYNYIHDILYKTKCEMKRTGMFPHSNYRGY